ncbi:MAG: hypothetical protein EA378_01520 [Phycisphaerales bacterium]|nr:MAG: hypothetical protein EA378_01520 [Phycisphaerales bacterium]
MFASSIAAQEATDAARRERSRAGVLIRCAADGELTPEQQPQLASLLTERPDLGAGVDSERSLREACGRVMGGTNCPEHLRARVLEIASRSAQGSDEAPGHETHHASAGSLQAAQPDTDADFAEAIQRRAPETRSRSFWTGPVRALTALAAVLVLTVSALFLGNTFLGNELAQPGEGTIAEGPDQRAERVQLASSFVAKEHTRCFIDPSSVASKFTVREAEAVPAAFEALTGLVFSLGDLLTGPSDNGLRFVDAGTCGVPGGAPAMHLRFAPTARIDPAQIAERNLNVSLFVQPATGWLGLEDGQTYRLDPRDRPAIAAQDRASAAHQLILAWQRGGLMHYLVADEPEVGEQLREQLGLPEPGGF